LGFDLELLRGNYYSTPNRGPFGPPSVSKLGGTPIALATKRLQNETTDSDLRLYSKFSSLQLLFANMPTGVEEIVAAFERCRRSSLS
jgi:hypothetical protein